MEIMQPDESQASTLKSISFTGKAGEYFSIWIVNVVLTILTLGIYSAWAKVRNQQYFYGNTWLDEISFRYLAEPIRILKGRLIAFSLFLVYVYGTHFSPLIASLVLLLIALLFPALLVVSMSFKMRYSSYRNVRFGFEKNFMRAYSIFFIPVLMVALYIYLASQLQPGSQASAEEIKKYVPIVGMLGMLIALMYPYIEFKITQFKIDNSRYGTARFRFGASASDYYKLYIGAWLLFAFVIIAFAVVVVPVLGRTVETNKESASSIIPLLFFLLFLPLYLWFFAFIQTKRTNLVFNNISIKNHKLHSRLKVMRIFSLYFTNTLGMALSFGLLIPWAKVRTARYRLSCTQLEVVGELDHFANAELQEQAAVGEEIGDLFDLDIGF